MWRRGTAVVAAAALAVAAASCGLGAGERSEGEATLTVTRDYGSQRMVSASVEDPAESETVIRLLDRETETTTRYGGGFVQSIEGVAGGVEDGRSLDWFFFVNGVESDRGAAEVPVRAGDRIWWDRRDWTDALRTPAVVGSWPEPFAQASVADGDRLAVVVECHGRRQACDEVAERLAQEEIEAEVRGREAEGDPDAETLRLLVGPWESVRTDSAVAQLEQGPQISGVFARFEPVREGYRLTALDQRANPVREDDSGAGLLAAVREGEEPPTWVITGTDQEGVEQAVDALGSERLRDRYALFASAEAELALPAEQPAE